MIQLGSVWYHCQRIFRFASSQIIRDLVFTRNRLIAKARRPLGTADAKFLFFRLLFRSFVLYQQHLEIPLGFLVPYFPEFQERQRKARALSLVAFGTFAWHV
ncbi:hypothetical protein MCOR02_005377 [Pyricularia oryzae]|nr:hypothetical protein MCOR02_005377 [Pyricularia oryzae]